MASPGRERLSEYRGGGACGVQGPQGSVLQCGGYTETLLKEDLRQDSSRSSANKELGEIESR